MTNVTASVLNAPPRSLSIREDEFITWIAQAAPGAAIEDVVAGPWRDPIRASPAFDPVVACGTMQSLGERRAIDRAAKARVGH